MASCSTTRSSSSSINPLHRFSDYLNFNCCDNNNNNSSTRVSSSSMMWRRCLVFSVVVLINVASINCVATRQQGEFHTQQLYDGVGLLYSRPETRITLEKSSKLKRVYERCLSFNLYDFEFRSQNLAFHRKLKLRVCVCVGYATCGAAFKKPPLRVLATHSTCAMMRSLFSMAHNILLLLLRLFDTSETFSNLDSFCKGLIKANRGEFIATSCRSSSRQARQACGTKFRFIALLLSLANKQIFYVNGKVIRRIIINF